MTDRLSQRKELEHGLLGLNRGITVLLLFLRPSTLSKWRGLRGLDVHSEPHGADRCDDVVVPSRIRERVRELCRVDRSALNDSAEFSVLLDLDLEKHGKRV